MKQLLITIAAVLVVVCNPNMGIHKAAYNGNAEVVNQLIATGTDINSKDTQGLTSLVMAVLKSQKEILEQLLNNGANLNLKNLLEWYAQ